MPDSPRQGLRVVSEIDYATRDLDLSTECCLNAESLRLLVTIAGLINRRVELYGRFGAVVLHELDAPGVNMFQGTPSLALGGGVKVALYETAQIRWGAGTQVLFFNIEDKAQKLSWHEVDLFVGPVIRPTATIQLYGGALASLIIGEYRMSGLTPGLRQHYPLGLFLGGAVSVSRSLFIGLDLRLIDEVSVSSRVGVDF